ncbi:hypothetical protein [Actinacidiphila guanduensis]|uniref:Uncharacterized protein n=1 Tax=Actinacidiphila guanduensis TaxID=310781 RepID=A0A1G9XYU7_9ACTN|nr:hypothetical protein [Actinacidiphila guanduensis]SDN01967.1 hypothetical protein SAMN05216259_102340 [Actinacidiphila guanduensis]
MSSMSRRAVLGFTGTAAAGALVAGAGPAQAADIPQSTDRRAQAGDRQATGRRSREAHAEQAGTTTTDFPPGTQFTAHATQDFPGGEDPGDLTLTFSVTTVEEPPAYTLTPLDIATALSEYAQSRGWPALTFYGTPAPAPLN